MRASGAITNSSPQAEPEGPLISVIILAYRRRQFLARAVQSVVSQTLDRHLYEVIVVAAFDPAEVVKDLTDIRCFTLDVQPVGPKIALALRHAKGRIVSFLEDDDFWDDSKLENVISAFSESPEISFCSDSAKLIDRAGTPLSDAAIAARASTRDIASRLESRASGDDRLIQSGALSYRDIRRISNLGLFAQLSTLSVLKSVLLSQINTIEEINVSPDSFVFYLWLSAVASACVISHSHTFYRIHDETLSKHAYSPGGLKKDYWESKRFAQALNLKDVRAIRGMSRSATDRAIDKTLRLLECHSEIYLLTFDFAVSGHASRRTMLRLYLSRAEFIEASNKWFHLFDLILAASYILSPALATRLYLKQSSGRR